MKKWTLISICAIAAAVLVKACIELSNEEKEEI